MQRYKKSVKSQTEQVKKSVYICEICGKKKKLRKEICEIRVKTKKPQKSFEI